MTQICVGRAALTPDTIKSALYTPLPGLQAMVRMTPILRPLEPPTPDHQTARGRRIGVALPLRAGWRAASGADPPQRHAGQTIAARSAFLAAASIPATSRPSQTALREACEEIGVCDGAADLQLLGDLTPLYIPPSDFRIYPHVVYLPHRPHFVPQPDEVAELLEVPVSWFL